MYCVLSKEGRYSNIIHFLADSDDDLLFIVDICDPGSTVKVLGTKPTDVHEFIKAPNGKWTLHKGTSSWVSPKNDAKVAAPDPKTAFFLDEKKKISDYQQDIRIYPSGLATGILIQQTVPETKDGYSGEQCSGHYFTALLEKPEGASTYSIWTEGQERKKEIPFDGFLTVRYENMSAPTKTGKRIKVVYDTKQEFEFALDGLTLV